MIAHAPHPRQSEKIGLYPSATLEEIASLKTVYGLTLTARDSHRLRED